MKISSKYEQHATDLCYSSSVPPFAPPPLTAVLQLLVLLENIPEQDARPKRENESLLNGPQVDTSKAGVVASQDQVDDLLDSLGF